MYTNFPVHFLACGWSPVDLMPMGFISLYILPWVPLALLVGQLPPPRSLLVLLSRFSSLSIFPT